MEYVGSTDKELDKMYEEIRKEEEKDRRKFLTDWKYFLQHISYNSNLAKEMLRESENRPKGFVLTYEVETSKYDEFPRNKHYCISDSDIHRRFTRFDGEGQFHWLVWQTTGVCGDDYSGYLLLPLDDERYWLIDYSM